MGQADRDNNRCKSAAMNDNSRSVIGGEYQLSKEDSEVISYLKALFAVMVVFIHARYHGVNFSTGTSAFDEPGWLYWLKEILSNAVPSCAVPGFFLISGLLLYRKSFKWGSNILRKVRTLLIPYLLAQSFWILFYALAQNIPGLSVYFADPHKFVANWGALST